MLANAEGLKTLGSDWTNWTKTSPLYVVIMQQHAGSHSAGSAYWLTGKITLPCQQKPPLIAHNWSILKKLSD